MNGRFVEWHNAKVHVLTHGLHYATVVFEGIRCYKTDRGPAIFRLNDHIRRLFESAKTILMKIPFTQEEICEAVKETIRRNNMRECYIRPLAYFGYKKMGINTKDHPVDVSIACWPWGTYLGEESLQKGVRCKISSWRRINTESLLPLAKTSANYLNSVLAKREALDCGYDEAILLNSNGWISEGPGENIFIVKNGAITTPGSTSGALFGITKDSVITIAKNLGIIASEQGILRDQLFLADEAFFSGTAAEITPIREVDDRIIGNGSRGTITEKIQSEFFQIVKGKNDQYASWLEFL
jgi:branched-chain amino acid aminotransferase